MGGELLRRRGDDHPHLSYARGRSGGMVRRAFRGHRSRLGDRRTRARRLFRYRDRAGDEHLHRPRWAGWIRRRHRGGDPRAHGKHDIPPLRAHLTRHREHPRHRRRRHAHRERTRRIFCGSDRLQHQPLLRQPHPRHRLRNGHESHRQPPLLRMVQGRLRHRSRRQRADRGLCGGACRHHRQRERRARRKAACGSSPSPPRSSRW